eukprot:g11458.t2
MSAEATDAVGEESGDEAASPTKTHADDGSREKSTSPTDERTKPDSDFNSDGLGVSASASALEGVGGGDADSAAVRATGDSSDGGGYGDDERRGGRGMRRERRRAVGGGGRRGGEGGSASTAGEDEEAGGGALERDELDADVHVGGEPGGTGNVATPPGSGGAGDSAAPTPPAEKPEGGEEEAAAVRVEAGETGTERTRGDREGCQAAATEGCSDGQCSSHSHSCGAESEDGDPSPSPNRGNGAGGGVDGGDAVDMVAEGPPESSASSADGTGVTGNVSGGGEQQDGAPVLGVGVESTDGIAAAKSDETAPVKGVEGVPGQQGPSVVPVKASRTLADAAAFVEAEGIAADAAYTDALNAAQAQEGHQPQGQGNAAVAEAERALAALAAAALQPSAGSAAAPDGVVGGGGATRAPAAPAGVTFTVADRAKDNEQQLYEGDCSASDTPAVWRQLQAPHMAFIQCQLAVLVGLVMLILICWRRHGRMISVLYAPPADVATHCHVANTP